MKNNQLLPFERNRYYSGKMLTTSDFQTEQLYMNNKRRFMNSVTFGSGIICGLSVFSLDDLSILVESGAAVDDYGREIVVDSSVVKKLSSIEGFESLNENRVYLCLRYKEDDVHSVYSVGHQNNKGSEYEYNRINEGYELFLVDESAMDEVFLMDDEFLNSMVLFENADFKVTITMPQMAPKGKNVKVVLRCEKLSDNPDRLSYEGILQIPTFTSPEGDHELALSLDDINLFKGQNVEREFWMKAQDVAIEGSELVIKTGSVSIKINDSEVSYYGAGSIKSSIVDMDAEDLVTYQISKLSLEMRTSISLRDYLVLAKLELVRSDSAYIIEKIIEENVKKYIVTPSGYPKRAEYLSYFKSDIVLTGSQTQAQLKMNAAGSGENINGRYQMASGLLEIPIGDKVRRGEVRYSGEIMHGLGKGNVYVSIGLENYEEDSNLGTNAKSTIYGKADLFEQGGENFSGIETAVKVLNDKGSFIVAAKLNKDPSFLMLTYRWVAIKFPSGSEYGFTEDTKNKSITAETPTVVLGTKDSYFFNVRFQNMDKCSIAYELTEEGSGEISAEGIYTAPSKEGVYEIRIYCTDMPFICTYAYAIVKKKGLEENENK